ncbi:hypothetical protein A3A66_01375 [Microgenomates group bacterium RIFCSPLOWO2_01_FULL_46_13]|nr:MAG: hypothetical protein A2783_02565 [Microgenomates group bacterium RIFCSPHIGHO2_01_FULL_45_11]OGV94650.1 MAG: hypothetical protein A3A66_01375 [Microgenomates group bacterium RIFCSPLOWO2_01_FULL_46_13]
MKGRFFMDKALKNLLKSLKLNESTISTVLGGLVVVVIGVLLFNYFKSSSTKTVAPEETPAITEPGEVELITDEEGKMTPKNLPTTHTVLKGENLWTISEKYFGNGYNWPDIAKANNLKNANVVWEGAELTIPQVPLRFVEKTGQVSSIATDLSTATTYTVGKGDHLWSIAVRAYGDGYKWVDIFNANKDQIVNPGLIEIGQKLILPR